jgi:protein-S-isoprenylcysteine O-methyltransferase Ste14
MDALAPIARLIERRRLVMAQNSPEGKSLRTFSFVIHATRGVIRDQNTRHKTMFAAVLVALGLLFSGSTFLRPALDPGVHPGWFIVFWFACAWITLLAALLAVFDMFLVRAQARAGEKLWRKEISQTPDSPSSRDSE